MKKYILFLLALSAMDAQAQFVVTGTLKSDKDKQPIPYANIAMMRASDSVFLRGVITDDKGTFRIDNDTLATVLRISSMGYETQFVVVPNTRNGGPTGLGVIDMGTIMMHEGAMLLDAVKITETRPLYTVDGEKDLYNVAEDASIQTGNASDALQNAPGVEVDVEGNVTLNGSSVEVWINDRPSHLEGEALKQYIKMLPANSIDRIEVMKNPSAKYGGGSPVVNIITSQRMLKNSFFSFGANGSSQPSISPWISYVYSNEKFHISAYVNYSGSKYNITSTGESQMLDSQGNLSRDQNDSSSSDSRSHHIWASINANYQFDSMNTISGWFGTYPSWSRSNSIGNTRRIEYIYAPGDYSYHSESDSKGSNYGGYGGIDFTHKFNNDGHELSVNLNGSFYGNGNNSNESRTYLYLPLMNYSHRSSSGMLSGDGELGIDYSLPYSKQGEIEAGLTVELGGGHDYSLRDTLDNLTGLYHCDYLRSDSNYTPSHGISSYLTWRRKWGNFTLKLGGRASYVYSKDYHLNEPQYDVTVHNWTFSPSIHASYRTEDMHNFSLSYRYRTGKPLAGSLSTYESYGIESFSTGNPLLEPEYTHNADLSWNKYFSKFGSVGASASFNADLNEYTSIIDARYVPYFGRVVRYSMPYNCSNGRKFSLNANCMYRPTAFLNVRLNMGLTDDWYSVIVRPGEPAVEDEMLSFSIRGKVWAKLWDKLEVFVSGYYNTPSHGWTKLSISHERKGIDLGMSADFFDRKLSLYLNASDIFDWNSWGSTNINPYSTSISDSKYTSRYITFGLTLRFGKMELESRAQTGATEASAGGGE